MIMSLFAISVIVLCLSLIHIFSVTRFFHENGYSDVRMMDAFGVIPEMMEKGIIESADYYTMFAFQCVAALGLSLIHIWEKLNN